MVEHTATPWRSACFQIYAADKSRIAHTGMGQLPPHRSSESEANAAFIVKAANNYDALVKALEDINAEVLPELCASELELIVWWGRQVDRLQRIARDALCLQF